MGTKKTGYITLCCILLVFLAGFDDASFPAGEHRLLVILSEQGEPYRSALDFTMARLSSLGYVNERNLTVSTYSLDHYKGRARRIFLQEAGNRFDLIVVFGTIGALALKAIIFDDANYPKVVFSCVTDPVGAGLIKDLVSPPAHNFTGVTYAVPVDVRLNFVKRMMPDARKIGLIYADMPQSHSYNQWLRESLENDPRFNGYEILFRSVPFVKSKGGMIRMAMESIRHIKDLDQKADLFLSANDQLGSQPFFSRNVFELSGKPLVGLNRQDVMARRGATMVIFPSPEGIGSQTADIIHRLLKGAPVRDVTPQRVHEFGVALDMAKIKHFGIAVPDDLLEAAGENIIDR